METRIGSCKSRMIGGECIQPWYNELANIPLFIWEPRSGKKGERNDCLVQKIDLAPTLLEYFSVSTPKDMFGEPLKEVIAEGKPVHKATLFGQHGGNIRAFQGGEFL